MDQEPNCHDFMDIEDHICFNHQVDRGVPRLNIEDQLHNLPERYANRDRGEFLGYGPDGRPVFANDFGPGGPGSGGPFGPGGPGGPGYRPGDMTPFGVLGPDGFVYGPDGLRILGSDGRPFGPGGPFSGPFVFGQTSTTATFAGGELQDTKTIVQGKTTSVTEDVPDKYTSTLGVSNKWSNELEADQQCYDGKKVKTFDISGKICIAESVVGGVTEKKYTATDGSGKCDSENLVMIGNNSPDAAISGPGSGSGVSFGGAGAGGYGYAYYGYGGAGGAGGYAYYGPGSGGVSGYAGPCGIINNYGCGDDGYGYGGYGCGCGDDDLDFYCDDKCGYDYGCGCDDDCDWEDDNEDDCDWDNNCGCGGCGCGGCGGCGDPAWDYCCAPIDFGPMYGGQLCDTCDLPNDCGCNGGYTGGW